MTPDHYDLAFVVDLGRERFDGTETIRVNVAEPTSRVVLNAVDIEFRRGDHRRGRRRANRPAVSLDEASQTATLTVPKPLAQGPTEIHIRYGGVLNSQLRGFYISKTKLRKLTPSRSSSRPTHAGRFRASTSRRSRRPSRSR